MRIVFMGTPEFAVPALSILHRNGYEIVAVVTATDKPAGRGNRLMPSPIKRYAEEQGLLVLQPEKLRNTSFLAQLQSLNADLQVVVAFRMLPAAVFSMPRLGCINLHASLLPQYRGAAPINWAIIHGETETGLTTFYIEQDIDTGKMIGQTHLLIGADETAGELHDRMMQAGAQLLLNTVQAIETGTTEAIPQPVADDLRTAPKIFTDTARINWAQSAQQVHNFVRGMSPYPGAFTCLGGQTIKVLRTALLPQIETNDLLLPVGAIVSDGKKYLHVVTAKGMLSVIQLQISGKRPMSIVDYLNGHKLPATQFTDCLSA